MTGITPAVIAAAQAMDYAGRPSHESWSRVPDSQVGRLIDGAIPHLPAAATGRTQELEKLAAEILAEFSPESDNDWRARAGHAQIRRWLDQLGGS